MQGNLNPSARGSIVGVIPPQSAGVGTITSGWIDMRNLYSVLAAVNVGVIGAAGTVDAKIEQATSDAGAGAKSVPGLAITQLAKAGGDNKQAVINLRQEDLDKNASYRFARLSVTIGGAATLVSGVLIGFDTRYGAASGNQLSTVGETVS